MKIIVIGGDPAGLFTAIALRQKEHDVVVLEAGTYTRQRAGEHLGAEARSLLKNLNIPNQILEKHSIPCTGIDGAWGQEELIYRSSIFNPYGERIILTRPAFDSALASHCKNIGIDIHTDRRVSHIIPMENGWAVTVDKQQYEAEFLVDASGRNSKFSKVFNTEKISYDDLMGISRVYEPTQTKAIHSSKLLIESTPCGWWYSVQLPSGDMVATFMTSVQMYSSFGQSQELFWSDQLNKTRHTNDKLRGYLPSGKLFIQ